MINIEILEYIQFFFSLFFFYISFLSPIHEFKFSSFFGLHRDKIYLPIRFILDQGFVIVSLQFTIPI